MTHPYDISVVIVNYNVRHFLVECLESFYRSKTDGLSIEVFVVDNASIDGSVEVVQSQYPDVKLIANTDNVGFSTANNQAIRVAAGEYILLLNPDTVLEEDTLRICYDYMAAHSQVGALGVKMIDGAGTFLPESKRALPTAWNSFTKLAGLSSLFPSSRLFNGYALGHLSKDERHRIEVLCGAFMFMPKQVLDEVGLLDERFFMYGEDIDLSYRIVKGGYEVHYIPDTTIIHYKGESTKKGSLNYVKTFYNAMGLYVDKHYTSSGGVLFGYLLKLGIWLRATLSAARRLVGRLWPKVLDAVLIFAALFLFSAIWAQYYFRDADYYAGSPLSWNIALYTTLWIVAAWLIGYYKKSLWRKRLQAVLMGAVAILGVYALLDEGYRTSRVIILAGVLVSWLVFSVTALVRRMSKGAVRSKNILIVAMQAQAELIKKQLLESKASADVIGIVYPADEDYDTDIYINNISNLSGLTRVLKADEVIFSTEDMTTKDIMKTMMQLDSKLSYKIAGDESLTILGSKSKNTSGEIYDVDLQYNLNTEYYQHVKRVFDVVVSLLFLVLFPITLAISGFRVRRWLGAILATLSGRATWVGYSAESVQGLPHLPKAIYSAIVSDREYARKYTVWLDIEVLLESRFVIPRQVMKS